MKRLSKIISSCALVVLLFSITVLAAEEITASGHCGDGVMWSLSRSGELQVYGEGAITEYSKETDVPWSQYKPAITSLKIESGITSITGYAFKNCPVVTSISIANSVEVIDQGALSGCGSLKEITLPFIGHKPTLSSSDTIYPFGYIFGSMAYDGAIDVVQRFYEPNSSYTSYTSYYIPESLTTVFITTADIPKGAFYSCSNLTTIVLREGITSVGESAFFYCDNLTSITLPQTLTTLGSGAFEKCSSLANISLPDQITVLNKYLFYGCTALANVVLPSQLESIDSYTFRNCDSLTSIDLPTSLRRIESYAFGNCGLQSLNLPEGITSINSQAFLSCLSLTSVYIPSSLMNISGHVFDYCPGLTSAGPATGNYCIRYAWTESIPAWAFSGCEYLTAVTLPDNITAIPSYLFSGCKALANIEIPSSVTSIDDGAFSGCTGLSNVIIPNNVSSIGYNAFSRCSGLKYIVFPKSIRSIGWGVLQNCSSLNAVFYFGTENNWNNISISNNSNTILTDTTRYYIESYSEVCNVAGHIWNQWKALDNYLHVRTCSGKCNISQTEPHRWIDISESGDYFAVCNDCGLETPHASLSTNQKTITLIAPASTVTFFAAYDSNGKMLQVQQGSSSSNIVVIDFTEIVAPYAIRVFLLDTEFIPKYHCIKIKPE